MEFYYIIDNIDMYQNAIILLNYLRPEPGTNIMYMNGANSENNNKNNGIRSKGFFDNKK